MASRFNLVLYLIENTKIIMAYLYGMLFAIDQCSSLEIVNKEKVIICGVVFLFL